MWIFLTGRFYPANLRKIKNISPPMLILIIYCNKLENNIFNGTAVAFLAV